MNRILVILFAAVTIWGCQQEAREEIGRHAGDAVKSAATAAGVAFSSAMTEAKNIDWKASQQALDGAKTQLINVQNELANMKAPTALSSAQLDSVKAELQRLDAASAMKSAETQMLEQINAANDLKATTLAEVERQRAALAEANAQFKALDEKYRVAQSTYDAAAAKVAEVQSVIDRLKAAVGAGQ